MNPKIEIFEEGFEIESIEITDVKKTVEEKVIDFINNMINNRIPLNADMSIEFIADEVDKMEDEAPTWVKMTALANDAMRAYSITKPLDMIFGFDVCCHGAGISCTDGEKVTYEMDRAPASSPENFKVRYGHYPRIWRTVYKGGTMISRELVLIQDRLGRAQGVFGWDKYKKLVACAAASFRHNFEEALLAFAKYARIPLKKVWTLPNIIPSINEVERRRWHCIIADPPCFCPPAVLRYRTRFPILNRVLVRIGLYNPDTKPANIGVEVWRYDKSNRARISNVQVPPGNSELRVTMKCSIFSIGQRIDISNGYVVIDPIDASKGISVTYATTEPKPVGVAAEDMYGGLI